MIAIVNTGGDIDGWADYEMRVTATRDGEYEVLARFRHYRPDGLIKCMETAIEEYKREQDMKTMRVYQSLEEAQ